MFTQMWRAVLNLSVEGCMIHLLLVALLTITGCYSSGNASVKSQELVSQVKIGQSTKKDVTLLFGQPNSVTRGSVQVASQGNPTQMVTVTETWGYQHSSSRTDGRSWIPFAGLWLGGTDYEVSVVQFGFDSKDVVQQVSSSSQKGRANAFGAQSQ